MRSTRTAAGAVRHDPAARIHIGEYAWLGESTVVLANVGRSAMVGGGSVVSGAVPPGTS